MSIADLRNQTYVMRNDRFYSKRTGTKHFCLSYGIFDLRESDLCESDLCEYVLCESDLCEYVLCESDLCEYFLCEYVLWESDLCESDLCEYVLCESDLCEFDCIYVHFYSLIYAYGK